MAKQEQKQLPLRGLSTVRVEKGKLLSRIKANRDDHRKIFEEALTGWQKQLIADLQDAVDDAKAGRAFRYRFKLTRPEDHTDDYDSVISLLEMSEDSEFELSWTDFQRFVMDKWDWQAAFLATSSSYGSTLATEKGSSLNLPRE
jgi:hypothetical protein